MGVIDQLTNWPTVLGRKTYPRQTIQRGGIKAPAVVVAGETPIHMAQRVFGQMLPTRGAGLILGTARKGLARGRGTPLTDVQRAARHKSIFGQALRKFPLLTRLRGQIGPLGNTSIPAKPYVRTKWGRERSIAELPAVQGIIPGPEKSVHASSALSVESI